MNKKIDLSFPAPTLSFHERLKRKIHSYRFPLTPRGQWAAGCVYVTASLALGVLMFSATQKIAAKNHKEMLKNITPEMLEQINQQRAYTAAMAKHLEHIVKDKELIFPDRWAPIPPPVDVTPITAADVYREMGIEQPVETQPPQPPQPPPAMSDTKM